MEKVRTGTDSKKVLYLIYGLRAEITKCEYTWRSHYMHFMHKQPTYTARIYVTAAETPPSIT